MKIHTVGDIRKAIENHDDGETVFPQVVATDGGVFYMPLVISDVIAPNSAGVIVDMRHDNLKSLIAEE